MPHRTAIASLAALAFASSHVAAPKAVAADLISIRGISIRPDEFVAGFELATNGIDVLALCHVLPDWTITVSNGHPPDSHVVGDAHHGASSLPAGSLDRLTRLLLVEPQKPAASGTKNPEAITGFLTIGMYGSSAPLRKLPLAPANILREPAPSCR